MESLVGQTYAFVSTIIIGATASFFYDYYRAVRRVFRFKKVGTFLGDIAFWLFTTALVFLMLLRGNWGELRLYVFIGFGLGALIYFRIFSATVNRVMRLKFYLLFKLWELLVKLFSLLWTIILFPFRLLILVLTYPLYFLQKLFRASGRKTRVAIYILFGGKLKGGFASVKSKLAWIAFWKRKKGE